MKVKARPDFGSVIARAGITRGQIAAAAGVSARTIDALARPEGAQRAGNAREVTAWRIARGFAALTEQTKEAAFAALFEESAPKETRMGNSAPMSLAM